MIYLASPYSHEDQAVVLRRYRLVCQLCALAFKHGFVVYSPIVHWHAVAEEFRMKTDAESFWRQNKEMIRVASELWIAQIAGLSESKGVKQEVEYARSINCPLRHVRILTQNEEHKLAIGNVIDSDLGM